MKASDELSGCCWRSSSGGVTQVYKKRVGFWLLIKKGGSVELKGGGDCNIQMESLGRFTDLKGVGGK